MVENLLRPTLLARALAGLTASLLVIGALRTAYDVTRRQRRAEVAPGSEEFIGLERRAELAATLVRAALFIQILGLALTVLAADRLHESLRGAMCAYGVFASTDGGFTALAASALAAVAGGAWLNLNDYDLALPRATLTPRKFALLFLLAPIAVADFALTMRFIANLDLQVIASCCASQLDPALQTATGASFAGPQTLAIVAGSGAAVTIGLAFRLARRPSPLIAYSVALLGALTALFAAPAIVGYVAPHVYGSPVHTCPFCLLHAEHGGIGWWLFGALFFALDASLGAAVIESHTGTAGERRHATELERQRGRLAAIGWALTLALAAAPVVRYLALTGGVSVFGGGGA